MFNGIAILKIRSTPLSPFYAPFFERHSRVQFELSVQGRFLFENTQTVYMGAELGAHSETESEAEATKGLKIGEAAEGENSVTLSLSVMKRGICRVLLNLIGGMVSGLHWSFGDRNELPHITFPLVKACDRFVCTKQNEVAPVLGVPMLEGTLNKKEVSVDYKFYPSNLYSVSFFSANLNLEDWSAVNVPGVKDIDLHSFWSKHPLYLIAYEVNEPTKPHTKNNKKYLFKIKIQHQSNE